MTTNLEATHLTAWLEATADLPESEHQEMMQFKANRKFRAGQIRRAMELGINITVLRVSDNALLEEFKS